MDWQDMMRTPEKHDALELPACVHKLQRPHVAGFVWRVTCPDCNGEGCCECDQTGEVETVLSPSEARMVLGPVKGASALLSALGIVAIILAVALLSCWQELARVVVQ